MKENKITKMTRLLFDGLDKRVALDRDDSDFAYFHALSLKLEYVTKVAAAGLLACVQDDIDRHRYSFEHTLVRADGIGAWAAVINRVFTGPAARHIDSSASRVKSDLSERVGPGDWRYASIEALSRATSSIGGPDGIARKEPLRRFFEIGAILRNRSRGHGAPTQRQCSAACPHLYFALDAVVKNLELFKLPWAYLCQNISGKYRVSPLLGDTSSFDYLKSDRDHSYPDGVYLFLDRPTPVPLIFSDADVSDIALPNGNHKKGTFEVLSYITNEDRRKDASKWDTPPGQLPPSETEGSSTLEPLGDVFTNLPLPPKPRVHIPRPDLEGDLRRELLNSDTHPIVSLTGPGGIGKTTIALAAINDLVRDQAYEVILWISARDVDLLEEGPKPVSPRAINQRDIARAAVNLMEPSESNERDFQPVSYFEECLRKGPAGKTLFVIDNFETIENPGDVYRWIDTHVRLPNKVLITTRHRDFAADYPIEIGGMTEDQANDLIGRHATRLGIERLMSSTYQTDLIRETDGHPYVIVVLLGEVAKRRKAVKPKRIVAGAEHILDALFERTYEALSPLAKRVFLLLSSWRVSVPEIAIEMVLLRPDNDERFDVKRAIEELSQFSFIDWIDSEEERLASVYVPLAAAMYGKRKLDVSPLKAPVEEDRRLLMEFGPGRGTAVGQRVLPRVENLFRRVREQLRGDLVQYEERREMLEYLGMRLPRAFLLLADVAVDVGESERAKEYVRRYLEGVAKADRLEGWEKLADICRLTEDYDGEMHALGEAAALSDNEEWEMGRMANRLNQLIDHVKKKRKMDTRSVEMRRTVKGVIRVMESRLSELSATNCSRLAWLHLNVGNEDRAVDVARLGIGRDPDNEHCVRLMRRLDV